MAGVGGMADMLKSGDVGGPPMPEEGSAPMAPEEAVAFLESKGLTPDDLPMLIEAIVALQPPEGEAAGPPEDMPPEPMPDDEPAYA
jgi:hypothetical protein